ncbi:MAG: Glu-tRNA(Gln) amidotransferase GatDE subunit E [Planctomycetota bacterium]|nr:MAG: Glu-tRNA(Gln) amidotransferase GatDE subunit E [Planctomycetota bacterium]
MVREFKSFEEMTAEDYAAIGFKSGLEVHQQLATATKLFCRCPAGRYSNDYDAEILRHMRPTLSELGEYDGTALMEKKTRKNIFYRLQRDTVCTYEFDDTPPFLMSDEALDIALEIGLLLRLNMISELHIARKQYLDGSIPTGFQRTTIVGVSGWIPYKDRRIDIRQLGLEEDSCREVADVGHDRVYITDRLGTPLIEVVTEPQMTTPQETAEVCRIIGLLCRSTGKVRRGYGATRQDVNVSVRGGTRIEIKGVPQIWRIPRLVYNEARRQCALLAIRDELKRRGVTPERFRHSVHDVTRACGKVRYLPVRRALDRGWIVRCVVLRGFAGLLNRLTQEHTTFATEFSDRVRVIACLNELPNIVHSDTAAESLAARDWKDLRKRTGAGDDDVMVLVWGDERDTLTACEEIAIRAREATVGVPSDTRQALKDGTNGFERVLPGAERMYPDTDLPPIEIRPERVERIRAALPPFVWDRIARYRREGLPEDVIERLAISRYADLYERVVDELGVDPVFVAVVLEQRMKAKRRAGLPVERLGDDLLFEVFRAHADGRLARRGVFEIIAWLARTPSDGRPPADVVAEALDELNAEPIDEASLRRLIVAALRDHPESRFRSGEQRCRKVMGELVRTAPACVESRVLLRRLRSEMGLPVDAPVEEART